MYCAEFRLMPLAAGAPSFPPVANFTFSVPFAAGSGMFATPCERMQLT
jgi:hypothetical protein